MSSSNRKSISSYHSGFFWAGVVMSVACLALVAMGNSKLIYPVEHTALPLSWAFGGLAIFQFLVAELCHHADYLKRREKEAKSQHAAEKPAVVRQPVHFVVLRWAGRSQHCTSDVTATVTGSGPVPATSAIQSEETAGDGNC
jgi:hypothetical protein